MANVLASVAVVVVDDDEGSRGRARAVRRAVLFFNTTFCAASVASFPAAEAASLSTRSLRSWSRARLLESSSRLGAWSAVVDSMPERRALREMAGAFWAAWAARRDSVAGTSMLYSRLKVRVSTSSR